MTLTGTVTTKANEGAAVLSTLATNRGLAPVRLRISFSNRAPAQRASDNIFGPGVYFSGQIPSIQDPSG